MLKWLGVFFCNYLYQPRRVFSAVNSLVTCMQRILSLCAYYSASLLLGTSEETCSNGLPGIEADGVCCVSECPQCGGSRCGRRARRAGLAATDCCPGPITSVGVSCNDSEMAPCVIDSGRWIVHSAFDPQELIPRFLGLMNVITSPCP